MSKSVKTIIFDLGGIIVNLDKEKSINSFKRLGLEELAKYLDNCNQQGPFEKIELGAISVEEFCTEVREMTKTTVSDKEICGAFTDFLIDVPRERLEMVKVLKEKGYRTFVLSNNNGVIYPVLCDMIEESTGSPIESFFERIYISCEMKKAKPSRDIFEELLSDSGIEASEALFIDDGAHNIETAKELGFKTLKVESNESFIPRINELLG